ncbi:hypothetical protein [Nocardioides sp.]|uniref:hypothetical protein n=1 Tax=Nocardioides sp. TaxID=35761 RepID=UPI002CEC9343|nr:hypothetical protein [Nocardioides sp.]HSX66673.1 hypothetical protein [Nocardioides sp.]
MGVGSGQNYVTGLRETVKALENLGAEVADLKEVMGTIATYGAEIASSKAPRGRTGRLKASIRGNKAKGKALITAGRANVPYAGPINYGWPRRGIKPDRFMQDADRELGPRAIALYEEGINDLIDRTGLGQT